MKELKNLLCLLLSVCLLIALFPAVSLAANTVGASYTLSLDPDASEYTYARIPDRQIEAGTPVGELPVLSRSGYYFGGWYTGQIGEGQRYTAGTIMPERSVTLYAYWYIHNPGAAVNEPGESEDTVSVTTGSGGVITSVLTVTDSGARVEMQKTGFDSVAAGSDEAVTLVTAMATVTFSAAAVDTISAASDADALTFAVNTVDYDAQSERVRAVTGGRAAYDFTLMADDLQVSSLGAGSAAISVPYELQPGEDPNAVVVYYIDDAGGNPHIVRGAYNQTSGTVNFEVSHFSQYAVGYNKVLFADVPESADCYAAVTFCAARGITNGTSVGVFSPIDTLTRGQFIVMCMRAYDIQPDADPQDNFSDAGNTYYTGYLSAAKRLGISNGVGDNLYLPEGRLSTQDMLTLLYRTLDSLDRLPAAGAGGALSDLTDSADVADYAKDAVEVFLSAGAVTSSAGRLNPTGEALRAAMVQVLYNLLAE